MGFKISNIIPTEATEQKDAVFQDELVSALGIKWNAKDDCFCFNISQSEMDSSRPVAKRLITSDVAKH